MITLANHSSLAARLYQHWKELEGYDLETIPPLHSLEDQLQRRWEDLARVAEMELLPEARQHAELAGRMIAIESLLEDHGVPLEDQEIAVVLAPLLRELAERRQASVLAPTTQAAQETSGGLVLPPRLVEALAHFVERSAESGGLSVQVSTGLQEHSLSQLRATEAALEDLRDGLRTCGHKPSGWSAPCTTERRHSGSCTVDTCPHRERHSA